MQQQEYQSGVDESLALSVVLPVYNERDNLEKLNQELHDVLEGTYESWEIIYVDDGSSDGSYEILQRLHESRDAVRVVKLRGNFGQSAALDAGLRHSVGNVVVTMDSDLQNDPHDIPRLVSKLNEGYDCVSGWRRDRDDPLGKRLSSSMASFLRRTLLETDLHDYGCTLKAYTREAADEIELQGEMHRYIPPLLTWRGYRVTEIEVNHRPRENGSTKYSRQRLPKGFMDLINVWFWQKFSSRPLHMFGGLGITSIGVGIGFGLFAVFQVLTQATTFSDTASTLLAAFMVMIGVQFFVFGLLADISIKGYHASRNEKTYRIKEFRD
jgi:glycosyltransferase involved in cell wall biosynthesis